MARTKKQGIVQIRKRGRAGAYHNSLSLRYTIGGKQVEEALGLKVLSDKASAKASTPEREQDRQVWAIANELRALREHQLLNGTAEEAIPSRRAKRARSVGLLTYFDRFVARKDNERTISQYKTTRKYLEGYLEKLGTEPLEAFTLAEVDTSFCLDFGAYLHTLISKQTKARLSDATRRTAISTFKAMLNQAVDEGLLLANPARRLKRPSVETIRPFLLETEIGRLRALEPTSIADKEILRAFLFSCYCGLRLADIEGLQWANVERVAVGADERVDLCLRVQKTSKVMRLPLNRTAISLLGTRPRGVDKTAKVFAGLPSRPKINYRLGAMARLAGLDKKITYHISRHSFATMHVNKGTPINQIKELLGHSDISITAKYLHSLASDLREANNVLDK